jgi:hypothetical protein
MDRPLGEFLREALPRTDSTGRFTRSDARLLRPLVAGMGGGAERLLLSPERLFGPWVALPAHVQGYLRGLAESEIRGTMAFHPRGRVWPGLVRAMYTLERSLGASRRFPWLLRQTRRWAPRLWFRPRMTRDTLVRWAGIALWRWSARPRIAHLLAALGRTPQWLMAGFAEGVAVDRRCRGFFHDRDRRVVYGYLLGIDLVPTVHGVICHEANLNAGIFERTRRPLWETDPIPEGFASFVRERQMDGVIWVGADLTPLDPWFHAQLWHGLTDRGIEVEILEDARLPPRRGVPAGVPVPARALFPPAEPPVGTLVVRIRSYGIGPDVVVQDKEAFARALGPELTRVTEGAVKVLPLLPEPDGVTLPDDPGVPNLVYKYPQENKGEGVFFLRARDADHARALAREVDRSTGERGGCFQPWVSSVFLPGRRVYEYRTMILVTPAGVRFLSARRRESVTPVPDRLPLGVVEDRRPFIITGYFGNVSTPPDPAEESLVRSASLAVAEALAASLGRSFATSP